MSIFTATNISNTIATYVQTASQNLGMSQSLQTHFKTVLWQNAAAFAQLESNSPGQPKLPAQLSHIPGLTRSERQQILTECNHIERPPAEFSETLMIEKKDVSYGLAFYLGWQKDAGYGDWQLIAKSSLCLAMQRSFAAVVEIWYALEEFSDKSASAIVKEYVTLATLAVIMDANSGDHAEQGTEYQALIGYEGKTSRSLRRSKRVQQWRRSNELTIAEAPFEKMNDLNTSTAKRGRVKTIDLSGQGDQWTPELKGFYTKFRNIYGHVWPQVRGAFSE